MDYFEVSVNMFKEVWQRYDKRAMGMIAIEDLKEFIIDLTLLEQEQFKLVGDKKDLLFELCKNKRMQIYCEW